MHSVFDIARLLRALNFAVEGLIATWKRGAAFKQEVIACVILIPLTFFLHVSKVEQILLVASLLWLLVVEIINTAIEFTIDRISADFHPLSKHAKDAASAAVLVSLVLVAFVWLTILV